MVHIFLIDTDSPESLKILETINIKIEIIWINDRS